jgi:hypothetical protein
MTKVGVVIKSQTTALRILALHISDALAQLGLGENPAIPHFFTAIFRSAGNGLQGLGRASLPGSPFRTTCIQRCAPVHDPQ